MPKFRVLETILRAFRIQHASVRQPLKLFASIVTVLAATLTVIPCHADPIVVPGGYELESSSTVILHSVFGPPAAYASSPVPIGSYDFGTGSGPINVGGTSYIIDRLNTFTLPTIGSTASVPILLQTFSNQTNSIVPYSSFGAGATGSGYVTASVSPGYTAFGSEKITRTSDTGGTFTLSYTNEIVFYGSNGMLLSNSPVLSVTSTNGTWQSTPPPGALVIPGVNDDNFFIDNVTLQNSLGNTLSLTPAVAATPEPEALTLLGLGLLPMAAMYRNRRVKA